MNCSKSHIIKLHAALGTFLDRLGSLNPSSSSVLELRREQLDCIMIECVRNGRVILRDRNGPTCEGS